MRRAAALACGMLVLAGCEREGAQGPEQARPSAAAASPLSYESGSEHAGVKLVLPPAVAKHAALHRTLYERETAAMKSFATDAARDHAELIPGMPPYAMEVTWRVAAETPKLLSLVRDEYTFAGGAHPNSASTTLLFDKTTGREVDALVPAPSAKLDGALCDALKRLKAERGGVELDGETWSCPKWKDAQAALTPGAGGKAAGLTFLFSPYEVGPYAEGSYEVTLPAAAFRDAVAPAYWDEFAAG